MKRLFVIAAGIVSAGAWGQTPEFSTFIELRPTFTVRDGSGPEFRWNDAAGRYSLAGVRMILESGARILLSQRLERIDTTGDPDSLHEGFIDWNDEWRVGKQTLPFGQNELIRETVPAIRLRTQLLFDAMPLHIAVADGGGGRPQGVIARAGGTIGISAAVGSNFGVQSSALTQIRPPDEAPGQGRGYGVMLGIDGEIDLPYFLVHAELVSLREGATELDEEMSLSDVRVQLDFPLIGGNLEAGWTRNWTDGTNWFRAHAEIPLSNKLHVTPFMRFKDGSFDQAGVSAIVRF